MAPVDPLALLKAISPYLGPSGSIKSMNDVIRVISLMKEQSKLPGRCVYISVLRATADTAVLKRFLQLGGWGILHQWFDDFRKQDNMPFLKEVLKLFKNLPLSVDLLKQNPTPKMVNKLSRVEDDELKKLATAVVQAWMVIVKESGNSTTENSSTKSKKLKSKREDSNDKKSRKEDDKHRGQTINNIMHNKKHKQSEKTKANIHEKNSLVKSHKSEAKNLKSDKEKARLNRDKKQSTGKSKMQLNHNTELADVKPQATPASNEQKPKVRPKTVKTFHAKFRSTGLEEGDDTVAVKPSKKLELRKRRSDESDLSFLFAQSEKKIKPANLILPYEPVKSSTDDSSPVLKGSPKSKPAPSKLTKPATHLKESSGFMDALETQTAAPIRRKRKPSTTVNGEKTKNASSSNSSPTAAPKVPSFYKDRLQDEPESKKTKPGNGENAEGNASDFLTANGQTGAVDENGGPVSALTEIGKKNKNKKCVSWADESVLRTVHYFEMDDNERVNVNKFGTFTDLKTLEMKRERQAMMTARRLMDDKMTEHITWRTPSVITSLPPPLVEPGCNSVERTVQQQRESKVLATLFFNKDNVPDTPTEPDLERMDLVDPIIVPLDDSLETATGKTEEQTKDDKVQSVKDTDVNEGLPPAITQLLANMQSGLPPAIQDNPEAGKKPLKPSEATMAAVQQLLGSIKQGEGGNQAPIPQAFENEKELHSYLESVLGAVKYSQLQQQGLSDQDIMAIACYQQQQAVIGFQPMMDPNPGWFGPPPPGMPPGPFLPMQQNRFPPPRGPGGFVPRPRFVPHVLCRNFKRGQCRYGNSCRFLHPGLNGPPL